MSMQEYFQELQKGMLRVEDPEDQMVRFYGGLRREMYGIVDYKEYNSIQRVAELPELFQLKCLSPALEARPHLNGNNPSIPRI
jgi:hypothetical protein